MTGISIAFLLVSIGLVWGGLAASTVFLLRKPEVDYYPEGGYENNDH